MHKKIALSRASWLAGWKQDIAPVFSRLRVWVWDTCDNTRESSVQIKSNYIKLPKLFILFVYPFLWSELRGVRLETVARRVLGSWFGATLVIASDGAREEELVQRASWQRDDAARRGDSEKTWLEEVYYTVYISISEKRRWNQSIRRPSQSTLFIGRSYPIAACHFRNLHPGARSIQSMQYKYK